MNIAPVNPSNTPPRAVEAVRQTTRDAAPQAKRESADNARFESSAESRQPPKAAELQDAVKRLNDFVAPSRSEISFSIDDESGIRVVKILDSQSKEVIRQIPSEEAVELARALDKFQGLLIKDKA